MVRLAMVCGDLREVSTYILCERLRESALQQWRDRYACKADGDFEKAVDTLARTPKTGKLAQGIAQGSQSEGLHRQALTAPR